MSSNPSGTAARSLAALNAVKSAWRGDWSDFDGRSLRDQLDDWQVILLAELRGEDVTQAAAGFLSAWGVCPGGHWTQHCYEGCQP